MRQLEEWSQVGTEEEGFPCLQELYLQRCPNLKEKLPNACPSMVKLVINECMELASPLPRLPSLKYLELKGCDKVVLTSVVNFPSLEFLYINGIPNLPCLPNGFSQQLPPIVDLTIGGCDEITSLSNQIGFQHLTSLRKLKIYGCPKLENLPHGLHSLSSLTRLRIEGCRSLSSFPEMGLPSMLTDLTIEECEDLESLPGGMVHNSNLEILSVRGCSSLLSLAGGPESSVRGLPTSHLKSFEVNECEKLCFLPDGMHNFSSLQELRVCYCPALVAFPEGGLPVNLKSLWIENCENLNSLPNRMIELSCLQELYIKGCPSIMVFPGGGFPTNLESLRIINCGNLMPWLGMQLHKLVSLRNFSIRGCQGLLSFPGEWMLPTSLTSLCISDLPDLKTLSEGFQQLTSLEKLEIRDCNYLLSLPEEGLPSSLSYLEIWKCRSLIPRCFKEKGKDWHKIAHIPCRKYDYEVIL